MATLEEIRQTRIEKLKYLESQGINPYPVSSRQDYTLKEVEEQFGSLEKKGESVHLLGRILSVREQGKIVFFNFHDGTGSFQAFMKEGEPTSKEVFELFGKAFDIGDFVEVKGTLFTTKSGQKSIMVEGLRMLSKSLRPLPEKWHGLQDIEIRFRERELDILSDETVRERFITRVKLISSMRRFLDDRGFLEFETPVLQSIPGGANARPFVTHHNALDIELHLRIATEIYLKRLVVAGYNKVYEIGRLFRNEGIDHSHNPEFTTMEMYWAYVDKDEYLRFLEDLMKYVVREASGSEKVSYQGAELDFGREWPRVTFREAVISATGIDIDLYKDTESLVKAVSDKGLSIDFSNSVGIGEHYDQLFKKTARAAIKEPTWVLDYPVELKPLANRSEEDSTKSSSAQLIVNGDEIINAYYHELNDPLDQRARFEEQEKFRAEGSEDAQRIDEDFLRSMEYGMPPMAGVGIGIDRLAMLLTDTDSIKEVILFPTLKPKEGNKTKELHGAVAIINSEAGMERWQELNTIAHLTAALGAREGKTLFSKDNVQTKDGHNILLNIRHGISIKKTKSSSNKALLELVNKALEKDLKVAEFTREMIETTSDKKIEEITKSKPIDEIEFLGVLIFGPKDTVDLLTQDFDLY